MKLNLSLGGNFPGKHSQFYLEEKLNFVTIFPPGENVHLSKDVGQIPYIFAKEFGFNSLLITESQGRFSCGDTHDPSFKVMNLRKFTIFGSVNLSTFYHLWRNAKRINVLNLYHLSMETKLLSILYKHMNPGGFTYVKLDVNIQDEKLALQRSIPRSKIRRYLGTRFHHEFFRAVDVFSAESAEGVEIVSRRYPMMRNKLIEVTNGIEVANLVQDRQSIVDSKEDLIITVGRIGSYQKNNELFLGALAKADLKHWKVAIIGPYTLDFKILFDKFLKQNPVLQGRIDLVGNVSDKDSLMSWYRRAKILVITSRWEGFPLVFSEAQCHGNYIISTNVSSVAEITNNLQYGRIVVGDVNAISSVITDVIENGICSKSMASEIIMYAREKYDWKKALQNLHKRISIKYQC